MIRVAEQLAAAGEEVHKCVSIRTALPDDVKFIDHLQKKYSHQLGFLPMRALEVKIERGEVSLALENDEPAAYLLGNGNYLGDPHFGIIYQAAVSYDARRRLIGTALVQHFIDRMEPKIRLVGLWCAQDIEANEFWSACGFEAIAARHGSRRKGRVHIFWVGRTQKGSGRDGRAPEPLRYPRWTRGGLMRAKREVFGIRPGEEYSEIELPDLPEDERCKTLTRGASTRRRAGKEMSLAQAQRAFRYGVGRHICVVIAGVTRYLPVAPFDLPDFADLARAIVSVPVGVVASS